MKTPIIQTLKIKNILPNKDGTAIIVPDSLGYGCFTVSKNYITNNHPKSGGHYVLLKDGTSTYAKTLTTK